MNKLVIPSLDPAIVLVTAISVVAYVISFTRWRARSHGLPLPPGPIGSLPFLGNIIYMTKPELWKANRDLCNKYGDVVYVEVLGQSIVILGTPGAISDLLDKRSAVTSDRQQSPLVALSGQGFNIAFMSYGIRWRRHRQAFIQSFPSAIKPAYLEIQRKYAHLFLREVLADPTHLCEHMRYTFSCSIVKAAYGVDLQGKDDKNVALMGSVLQSVQAFTPGRFLVQYLHVLQHAPYWIPFAGGQMRQLAVWRADADEVKEALFAEAKERLRQGDAGESVLGDILTKADGKEGSALAEEHEIAKNVAITAFEGGADTTFASLQFFLIAMYLNPDIQKRAQAELDAVVGPNRLPSHNDKASLPYVTAVMIESLRWQYVAPFAVPHYTSEDLTYRGYFIPKGTVLLPQSWACLHDPEAYPEPERFLPDRFIRDGKLNPDVRDPYEFVFGYGRRVCPGRHFGEAGLFINIAMILHVFAIMPPFDQHGNEIVKEPKPTGSFLLYPEDCRCTITPRSAEAEALILGKEPMSPGEVI